MKKSFKELISRIKKEEEYHDQIVHEQIFVARKPLYAELETPLPQVLRKNLSRLGVERLFTHQAEAIEHSRAGQDVVVVTETASGKSLCYHLPVLEEICARPGTRALYIFPTKALAQDQSRSLARLIDPDAAYDEAKYFHRLKLGPAGVCLGTYDGDTPREVRPEIRRHANVLMTNPDMLSLGILPNHGRFWTTFFQHLKFVVIDEMHVYRGVFGSHVANVMRRLERVCARYGSRPRFICCSATTANPAEHASALLNRTPEIIDRSGAPSAKKIFLMWNPPVLDKALGVRVSALGESVRLFSRFAALGLRTIVFARSKPSVEVILKFTRDRLKEDPEAASAITSYRGGYLPEDRRRIEKSLSLGDILGVTCTNALELGVDIGSLDAAVINGYPGTIAATWQQAGRAGRRGKESLAVFVATDEPLDQYLMRNPDYFFGQSVERAIINPENPYIQSLHLRAAAYEAPLSREEETLFGTGYVERVRELIASQQLREARKRAVCPEGDFPADEISLRTSTAQRFAICDTEGRQIGMMDSGTVFQYLHDGAIYLHQGESWIVEQLDMQRKTAVVSKGIFPYYTRALSSEQVTIERSEREKLYLDTPVFFGYVKVTSTVHSYKKIRVTSGEIIERVPLDYPSEVLITQGLWFYVSREVQSRILAGGMDFLGGLHAVEHAAIAMLPFLAMCDRDDIGGLSIAEHPDTFEPTIFIHDGHPGGIGLSEMGYGAIGELLGKTHDLIAGCPCKDGCPSCIQSPKCGNMNEPLDKKAALVILKSILKKKE